MLVGDLIKELQKFDPDIEVTITDGYTCQHYRGKFEIINFVDDYKNLTVDIGIGGLNKNE